MIISRRAFLEYSSKILGTLGLSAAGLANLQEVLAGPLAPRVIWLQGAGCGGCSDSFLNYVSPTPPASAADVLISSINLMYHSMLMGSQGEQSSSIIQDALNTGGYILAVEGGIPTAFTGHACTVWESGGAPVTAKDALLSLASKATQVLSIGTCAAWGGVPKASPNSGAIASVATVIGRPTVNIAGCPTHPDWIVWGIVNAINGTIGPLDAYGRPTNLYSLPHGYALHDSCPKLYATRVSTYGQDNRCLIMLGCKGPKSVARCPISQWNNGVNWCTVVNSLCLGCVNNNFPINPLRIVTS